MTVSPNRIWFVSLHLREKDCSGLRSGMVPALPMARAGECRARLGGFTHMPREATCPKRHYLEISR